MSRESERIIKDIQRNRSSRYDKMIRQNAGSDMTAFRRKPYYMGASSQKQSEYVYPFAINDKVYELYAGRVYPLRVAGFYITEQGEYVIVENEDGLESRISVSNIYLSEKQALHEWERRKKA